MISRRAATELAMIHRNNGSYAEFAHWLKVAALPWWSRVCPPYLASTPEPSSNDAPRRYATDVEGRAAGHAVMQKYRRAMERLARYDCNDTKEPS